MDELDTRDAARLRLDGVLAVVRWRTERLLRLGYGLSEAAELALSEIDVHELERLIGMGCPPQTAIRIAA